MWIQPEQLSIMSCRWKKKSTESHTWSTWTKSIKKTKMIRIRLSHVILMMMHFAIHSWIWLCNLFFFSFLFYSNKEIPSREENQNGQWTCCSCQQCLNMNDFLINLVFFSLNDHNIIYLLIWRMFMCTYFTMNSDWPN